MNADVTGDLSSACCGGCGGSPAGYGRGNWNCRLAANEAGTLVEDEHNRGKSDRPYN
jgi:hypothetical protein